MEREGVLHAVLGTLFIVSFLASPKLEGILPAWHDPKLGLISFAIALIWLTAFFLSRGTALLDELKVQKDRIERLERRLRELEDDERLR